MAAGSKCDSEETIQHWLMDCRNNIELQRKLKEICRKESLEYNVRTLLSDNHCMREIYRICQASQHRPLNPPCHKPKSDNIAHHSSKQHHRSHRNIQNLNRRKAEQCNECAKIVHCGENTIICSECELSTVTRSNSNSEST